MGLAPYGDPKYVELIRDRLVELKDDGSFRLNMDYFGYLTGLTMTNDRFAELFDGPAREPESEITQREMDLARSMQVVTEDIVLNIGGALAEGNRRVVPVPGRRRGAQLRRERAPAPRVGFRGYLDSACRRRCGRCAGRGAVDLARRQEQRAVRGRPQRRDAGIIPGAGL